MWHAWRAGSSDHGEAPLGGERVEALLHDSEQVLVDLIGVRLWSELLTQVDGRKRLDRDFRWQWNVAEHVTDVYPPWQGERDRQHLEAEDSVQRKQPCQALAP